MPSDHSEDKTPPSQTQPHSKSRQERIRDNQRRSRARRQEYLTDLEKRLTECQITCRDADIQRAAFIELQIENTRLRELLSLAGVNDHFVEQYVSQAVSQAAAQNDQYPQQANAPWRQLRPKIAPISGPSQPVVTSDPPPRPPVTGTADPLAVAMSPTPVSPFLSVSPYMPSIMDADTSDFHWIHQPSPLLQAHEAQSLSPAAPGVTRVADDNSISYSVAKQMIDQYNIPPAEMEQVRAKLLQGLCQPAFPGGDCAIDNEVLFHILNELSMKYPV